MDDAEFKRRIERIEEIVSDARSEADDLLCTDDLTTDQENELNKLRRDHSI
ncbi:hypothetical protein SAMN03159338_1487 [Sphingomonas sp. NFR04]|jgi:DNA-binding transcriptional regulator GbsR (MarR family)|uniref:hypothetical protein n=1 Tax=Sphingomonas sp. NFR04 TaxID=1566283 RepID=UPI0008E6E6CE|nr:hypothetical protein [Sphingomonas sp. NFR04]SFJ47295.1 hypothetical protein SAMN03159338_1487 [Sphingomonas sp. NFR04]